MPNPLQQTGRESVLVVETASAAVRLRRALADADSALDVEATASFDAARDRVRENQPGAVVLPVDAHDGEWRSVAAAARKADSVLVLFDPDSLLSGHDALDAGAVDHVETLDDDDLPLVAARLTRLVQSQHPATKGELPAESFVEALDAVDDIVYLFTTDGRLRWWNSRLEEVTGYAPGELDGMAPSAFFTGDDSAQVAAAFQRAVDGERVTVEAGLVTANGDPRPFEFRGVSLDVPGPDAYVCGIGRDVSERVERERALQKAERQMEAVFQDPTTFAGLMDTEGRLERANAAALDFVGMTAATVRGRTLWELPLQSHSSESRRQIREAIDRANEGEYVRFQAVAYRQDGEPRTLDCSVRPVHGSDGSVDELLAEAVDITDREYLRHELDETLERINDALFAVDSDWRFTYANRRALELTGEREDELLGELFWDVFDAAVGTQYEREYRRAMRRQETVAFEAYYPPLEMWTEVRAYPSETGLSIYFRDVTERRRSGDERELLRETIQIAADATSFEGGLDSVLAAVCEQTPFVYGEAWVPDGGVLSVSATHAAAPDIPGEAFSAATAAATFERGVGLPGRVWAENKPVWLDDITGNDEGAFTRAEDAAETTLRAAVGVPIAVADEVIAVMTFFLSHTQSVDERLVALVSTGTSQLGEVMVRQETNDRLYYEEELQRRVFDINPVGIVVADSDGRLVQSNAQLAEILGLSTEEVTKRTFGEEAWQNEDQRGESIAGEDLPIGEVLATGESVFGAEHSLERGDGRRTWVRVNATPLLDEDGDVEYVVASVQDITAERDRQRQIRQRNEQLSVLNRVLRHDLRTHVNVVLGYTELLGEDDVDVETATARIDAQLEALLSTAEKTRYVAEYVENADPHPTSIDSFLEACLETLDQRLSRERVTVDLDGNEDVHVGTTAGLEFALVELLENAVSYSSGDVTVSAELREPDGDRVVISVDDCGPGIPEQELVVLEEGVEAPLLHSSGIGIWLARWLVEAHDGDLSISRREGRGTSCRVELPVVTPDDG